MSIGRLAMCFVWLVASPAVSAGSFNAVLPEPGTFELLALAGVVAVVVAIRGRRK